MKKKIFKVSMLLISMLVTSAVPAFAQEPSKTVISSSPTIEYQTSGIRGKVSPEMIEKIKKEHPNAKKITFWDSSNPSSVDATGSITDSVKKGETISPASIFSGYTVNSWVDTWSHFRDMPTQYITSVARGGAFNFSSTQTYSATVSAGTEVSGLIEAINLKASSNVSGTVTSTITSSYTFNGPSETSTSTTRTFYYLVFQEAFNYGATHYILGINCGSTSGTAGVPRFTMFSIDS